jgi:hypothetical protein
VYLADLLKGLVEVVRHLCPLREVHCDWILTRIDLRQKEWGGGTSNEVSARGYIGLCTIIALYCIVFYRIGLQYICCMILCGIVRGLRRRSDSSLSLRCTAPDSTRPHCSTHLDDGGGAGKRRGFLKSSTRMVALMITSLRGCMGSAYSALSCRGTLDHLADSAIAWARRMGSVLMGESESNIKKVTK